MLTSQVDGATVPQILVTKHLSAGYAGVPVIHDVSISVSPGEVAAIVGPNGAGKSTLLKAIAGALPVIEGTVCLGSEDVTNLPGDLLAKRGLGYVPQVDDVFDPLSVGDNLEVGGFRLGRAELDVRMNHVMEILPILEPLRDRLAARLSGGERKLLALGRAMMMQPDFLLLDEPTANLAPDLARTVLREHVKRLASSGMGVLLVEQRALDALAISDTAYVMIGGQVQLSGPAPEMLATHDIGALFLGRTEQRATSDVGDEDGR